MDAYLGKPIRVEELDALLQRWIAPARRAAPPAATEPAPADAEVLDVEVLDVAGLLDRVEGDLAFVRELADGLRNDGPRWLADLRNAFASGDRTTLEQTAHAIRGSVSNLGGHAASLLAERLERRARTLPLADGGNECRELETALGQLHRALLALGGHQLVAS
jgi:HPt (histidine-containing phosphotransfer) domain-containing protein